MYRCLRTRRGRRLNELCTGVCVHEEAADYVWWQLFGRLQPWRPGQTCQVHFHLLICKYVDPLNQKLPTGDDLAEGADGKWPFFSFFFMKNYSNLSIRVSLLIYLSLNNKVFDHQIPLIYRESNSELGYFLELDVDIKSNFQANIYDKWTDFQIIKFPDTKSNIPNRVVLNVFVSQLLRFLRVCSEMDSFKIETKELISSFQLKDCNIKLLKIKNDTL